MSTNPDADSGLIPTEEPSPALPRFPWPPGEGDPVVGGFADTWQGAVFRPVAFFGSMPESLSLGAALLYYLVIGILGAGIRLFWSMLLPRPDSTLLNELLGSAVRSSPLLDFLASPLYLLLSLLLAAGITHLLVLALVPGHRRFGTTLRIFCFAYSPVLFGVVPYLGSVVAFVWLTVLSITGIRMAHHTTWGRATAVVLLPIIVALGFLALAYALLVTAGTLLGR